MRPELKLKIYDKCILSYVKFLLTVHDLTKTQLSKLDSLSATYVKKWLEFPSRGATTAIIHSPSGLNIPKLSEVYFECHCTSIAHGLTRADSRVQAVVEQKLDRELSYTNKSYGNIEAAIIVESALSSASDGSWKALQRSLRSEVREERDNKWSKKAQTLLVQGEYLSMLHEQDTDLTWKSIIYNLPRRVMSFAVRASIDALPTFKNLQRWGKRLSGKCDLCNNTQTLHHVLNHCQPMLTQGRYTWRHDSILSHISKIVQLSEVVTNGDINVNVDLTGTIAGSRGTIPANIMPTTDRPDMVLYRSKEKEMYIFELTVPFERNMANSHRYKVDKYTPLVNDLRENGIKCKLWCVEIGSRGYVSEENKASIKELLDLLHLRKQTKHICQTLSRLALVTSYAIYNLRNEPQWTETGLMSIPSTQLLK